MFEYSCSVVRWVDGDTALLSVDLGFHVGIELRCRLYRVNAPELKTARGVLVAERMRALYPVGAAFNMKSRGVDRYGRWLVELTFEGVSVNEALRQLIGAVANQVDLPETPASPHE